MKLTGKVISLLVLIFIALLMVEEKVTRRHELEMFSNDMNRDNEELGHHLEHVVLQLWQELGEEKTMAMLDDMSNAPTKVRRRWVWLDPSARKRYQPYVSLAKLDSLVSTQGSQTSWFDHTDEQGDRLRLTYVEVAVDSKRIGAVELSERPIYEQDVLDLFRRRTIGLSGIALLLGGVLVTGWGHYYVSKPLKQLTEKTRRIGQGDLSGPLTMHRWDEFGELAVAINSMCEQLAEAQEKVGQETAARIATTEQLRHAERLHTVGRLASGVAHELGTPLNVVSGRAGLIESGKLAPEETKESAQIIKTEAGRMTKIIRQLLDFARRNQPQKHSADLRDVVTELLQLLDPLAERANYAISVVKQEGAVRVTVDVGQIQQVLTNLLMNAAQSMPDGGDIEIGFCRQLARPPRDHQAKEVPCVCVYVRDEGKGIPKENLHHIFEPFFTTKEVGKGTGLGLSISYGIVEEHGGWIDVQSQEGKGSRFSVYLPEEVD